MHASAQNYLQIFTEGCGLTHASLQGWPAGDSLAIADWKSFCGTKAPPNQTKPTNHVIVCFLVERGPTNNWKPIIS